MTDDRYVRSETFAGVGIQDFRALMERLAREGWIARTGERLLISEYRRMESELVAVSPSSMRDLTGGPIMEKHYRYRDVTPPSRSSWYLRGEGSSAGIEAYKDPRGLRVDFIDGYHPQVGYLADYRSMREVLEDFSEVVISEARQVEGPALRPQKNLGRPRGPRPKTLERADYFKKMKDRHPAWSQEKVAMEAARPESEGGLGESDIIADTVRNAYRAMGWEWERADRVR